MVELQKAICARQAGPNEPPGGAWETAAQPRLALHNTADQIDAQTAAAIEIWQYPYTWEVSSRPLGVEDAGITKMNLMCNPVRDCGPARWHREFYPPYCAPLQSYAEDIIENGPCYVQWNLPLYDDDDLWVVPGSHLRPNTPEENRQMSAAPRQAPGRTLFAGRCQSLWERFEPVDNQMQAKTEQASPGFQGGPTPYWLDQVPDEISLQNFTAGWGVK